MTPDRFAAWLEARGVVSFIPRHYRLTPDEDCPYFTRTTDDIVSRREYFYVSAGPKSRAYLEASPIVWDEQQQDWAWVDYHAPVEENPRHRARSPLGLLQLELARQGAAAQRESDKWLGLRTGVVNLAIALAAQETPNDP
jgi:hypothetical protein